MLKIEFGDPALDGVYLLFGFDVSFQYVGWPDATPGRPLARRSGLKLPVSKSGETEITFRFGKHLDMRGMILMKDQCLQEFQATGSQPVDVFIRVPPRADGVAELYIEAEKDAPKPRWFGNSLYLESVTIDGPGVQAGPDNGADAEKALQTYWGDIHVHSNGSLCAAGKSGSVKENCDHARYKANMDFMALTDHAEHLNTQAWEQTMREAAACNEPGRFAMIPAYEWSSELYGHRNLYFRRPDVPLYDAVASDTMRPDYLWAALKDQVGVGNVITAPHHPATRSHLLDWNYHDPEIERLVEIYQVRGQQERFLPDAYADEISASADLPDKKPGIEPGATVIDALQRGYRLGLTGGGDAHKEMAGAAGLTAVKADNLNPESLFDALYERRCYATTGARIHLDVSINGFMMGREVVLNRYEYCAAFPLTLKADIRGTDQISRVDVVVNGWDMQSYRPDDDSYTLNWELAYPHAEVTVQQTKVDFFWLANFTRYVYIRVTQADGQMAWSSPVWFVLSDNDA